MRILAIRGSNIASLAGEFAVELDQGALASAGLFAIVGPTGAGKSTLLDALCAALYNRTPRLDGRSSVKIGRSDEPEELHLSPFDPRSLLRRGAIVGWAEVDFEGRDGRRYRAKWMVRRARARAQGRIQDVEQSLMCVDTNQPLGGTRTETLAAIEDALGLSFDQFRRSALLAQGEFAAFLRADAAQRAELLERVTGTEIYGELSIAAHKRAAEVGVELDALRGELARIPVLADDERAALAIRRDASAAAVSAAGVEQARLTAGRAWLVEAGELARLVDEAVAATAGAEQLAGEVGAARRQLARVEAAEAARGPWRERTRAEAAARAAATEHGAATTARAAAIANDEARAAAARQAAAAQATARAVLEATDPDLRRARVLDERVEAARRIAREAAARAGELTVAVAAVTGERRALAEDERRRRDAIVEAAARLEAARGHVADAKAQHQDAHLRWQTAEERAQRQPLAPAEARLGELRDEQLALKELEQAQAQALRSAALEAELIARGKKRRGDGKRLRAEARALEVERTGVTARLAEAEPARDRLRIATGLAGHRAELVDGEACPLCGAAAHPWAGQGVVDELLAEQDARVAALRGEVARVGTAHAQAEASAAAAAEEVTQLEADAARAAVELDEVRERWRAGVTALGELLLAEDPSTAADWLATRVKATAAAVVKAQKERDAARKQADELRRLDGVMRARHSDLEHAVEAQRTSEEAHRLAEGAQAQLQLQLASLIARHEAAERAAAEAATAAVELEQRAAQAIGQRAALLDGRATDEVEAALTGAVRGAEAAALAAASVATEAHRGRAAAEARVEQAAAATARGAAEQAAAAAALREALEAAGVAEAELASLLAHDRGWLVAERARLDGLERTVADARAVVVERRARADDQRARQPAWLAAAPATLAQLDDAMAAARAEHAAADAELRRAVAGLEADELARARRVEREAELVRRSEAAEVHRQLAELIGSHDGRKLRTFAQSLSLDALLGAANHHLQELQPRYRLERVRGHDLELQVVDREMGEEVRSVHSLSGGESFLVSLALALALSSLSARNVRVRTLLIDEGFGTLDPSTLDVALDVLDALQSAGRQVGIISHVPGLAERVPVQVVVRPTGGGRSTVTVRAAG